MPRPKILNVNEGIGEALFYLYFILLANFNATCGVNQDNI